MVKFRVSEIVFSSSDSLPSVYEEDLGFFSEIHTWPAELPEELKFYAMLDGQTIGWIGLSRMRWLSRSAYITFSLEPEWRGKGYGFKMLKEFLEFYFKVLGFHRITAEIYEYNLSSLKLVKKLKFQEEGRLRKARFWNGGFYDIIIFGLLAEEFFEEGE